MNNSVTLIGRIVKDIELKKTANGNDVCYATLAIPRNYKNSEGVYETDFITCTIYKPIASSVSQYCKKGDLIGIRGMIQSRIYEKDGQKIYKTEIIAEKVTFLSQSTKKEEIKKDKEKNDDNKVYEEFSSVTESLELPF